MPILLTALVLTVIGAIIVWFLPILFPVVAIVLGVTWLGVFAVDIISSLSQHLAVVAVLLIVAFMFRRQLSKLLMR